jgi:response regulator RpfG family c-di-GMP phosphodiesterase
MSFPGQLRFLVVDDNSDSRFLLVKTLLRKFTNAIVLECQHGETSALIIQTEPLHAVIAHRTYDYAGAALIARLRKASVDVPIVMVSGIDQSAEALAAGATAFLRYDEWLRIGLVVSEAMSPSGSRGPFAAASAPPENLRAI